MTFQRITTNPEVCGGKPCIRGLRFPVSRLLGLLAAGETPETILKSYPYIEPEDIQESLRYAALLADEQVSARAKMKWRLILKPLNKKRMFTLESERVIM